MNQPLNNPLQSYYRVNKMYVKLPSGTTYYKDNVLRFSPNGEVGVKAMTSRDEMVLKNPDALLNGEAFREVLKSCVDGLQDVSKLLLNDVELLMAAIKHSTYGNSMDFSVECPTCSHKNTFSIDLSYAVSSTNYLDSEYVVTLESGISVFLKPYSYDDFVKTSLNAFEQSKIINKIQDDSVPEQERFKMLTKSFDTIAKLNVELMANVIVKLIKEDDNLCVENTPENKKHIISFLQNISKKDSDSLQEELTKINAIGLNKDMNVKCQNEKCGHEWVTKMDFNPVNFFTGS